MLSQILTIEKDKKDFSSLKQNSLEKNSQEIEVKLSRLTYFISILKKVQKETRKFTNKSWSASIQKPLMKKKEQLEEQKEQLEKKKFRAKDHDLVKQ